MKLGAGYAGHDEHPAYAASLREKIGAFRRETGTRGNCHLTFVTTYGLRKNGQSGMVQSEVTLDDLFKD